MSLISRLLKPQEESLPVPVEAYLREQHVPFSIHHHPPAFTAQRLAEVEHVPGRIVAKVVIALADDQMVMLCIPSTCRVNMLRLMDALGTDNLRLPSEDEFAQVFPDCEAGAMPPFGQLYGMPVYMHKALAEDNRIVFQAGTHTDAIEMEFFDFAKLVRPVLADLCSPL